MSKNKKQDSMEKKREQADLVARILQQHCPELRDLNYQNFEAKNDPPDLVFGEKDLDTSAFPVGVETRELHAGIYDEKGSLQRRIEIQKREITEAAQQRFETKYPDRLQVRLDWYEADGFTPQSKSSTLPLDSKFVPAIVDKLVGLIASQAHRATTERLEIEYQIVEEHQLGKNLSLITIARIEDTDGTAISNWHSGEAIWNGVTSQQLKQMHIEPKENKPFKQVCRQKWLVFCCNDTDYLSASIQYLESQLIETTFDRVMIVFLRETRLIEIPILKERQGCIAKLVNFFTNVTGG